MVLYAKSLRSRHDDLAFPLCDLERRTFTGHCRTLANQLTSRQDTDLNVRSIVDALNQRLTIRTAERFTAWGSIPLTFRNAEPDINLDFLTRHHGAAVEVLPEPPAAIDQVDRSLAAVLESNLTQRQGVLASEVAERVAGVFMEVLVAVPLSHGNLLLAETYAFLAANLLGVGPRPVEERRSMRLGDDRSRHLTANRDSYDLAIHAALNGQPDPIIDFFAFRISVWSDHEA
ncbi:MAG: hypothetical protein R2754_12740 [Microthrixaceae bacterium]